MSLNPLMGSLAFELTELLALLMIATAVAVLVKYIRLPYTIALVLVGLFVGMLRLLPEILLTEEIIFYLILPPLLFEGALNMDIQHIKNNLRPISLLAIVGVVVSTITVGYLVSYLIAIPLAMALLFGAMITPTDPVSVLAAFRTLGVPKRLSTIVEGESILNDGTGVVLFGILFEMIRGSGLNLVNGAITFFVVVVGGAVVGFILGYVTYKILGYIDDHLIEVTITLILAFSAFIIAESLDVSGVIAVVTAGLITGNYGKYLSMSPTTRVTLITFWGFIVFIVNSIVFLLIGLDIHLDKLIVYWKPIVTAILVVLVGRALSVYPLVNLSNIRSRLRIPFQWQHVIFWGGLHGTIPVALALGLGNIPHRDLLASMTFGVVLFSLVVQGLSMEFFIKRSSLVRREEKQLEYEELMGRAIAVKAAKKELEKMVEEGLIAPVIAEGLNARFEKETEVLSKQIAELIGEDGLLRKEMDIIARRRILQAEKSALNDAIVKGLISEEVARKIIEEIDVELAEEI